MMRPIFLMLLLAGLVLAAQPARPISIDNQSDAPPLMTARSSQGLLVNGVSTPRGVDSALIAPGDVIETQNVIAILRYKDGHTVTLAPATKYSVTSRPGNPVIVIGRSERQIIITHPLPPANSGIGKS